MGAIPHLLRVLGVPLGILTIGFGLAHFNTGTSLSLAVWAGLGCAACFALAHILPADPPHNDFM